MDNISQLKPTEVWTHFYALTQIPRPSKKEEKIIDFIYNFGKSLGLETIKDEVGNIIIRKPATLGMENKKGIILQSHLDMVPQKNNDKVHDFENDPITTYIDGEWVVADGTTLGADNGIGVAAAMAVLESKTIKHGPIEALFTTDEETGMTGAQNLKSGLLKGDILINLDSEDEGELYVGCAGGIDGTFTFKYKEEETPANTETYKLSVTGAKGGHSGTDISLGRSNANKIICRILKELLKTGKVDISSILGGNVRNAIPREAFANIVISNQEIDNVRKSINCLEKTIKAEFQTSDSDIKISLEKTTPAVSIIEKSVQEKFINSIIACPNGIMRMSDTIDDLVETSTNLAIIKSENGEISVSCLIRSSVDSAKFDIVSMEESVFSLAGAESKFTGSYPGWKPNSNSFILSKMKEIYKELYGKEPEIKAIHAGLECGLLGGIYPNWDMISCGPTIKYPHSPDERVDIATVDKWWILLINTLEKI